MRRKVVHPAYVNTQKQRQQQTQQGNELTQGKITIVC